MTRSKAFVAIFGVIALGACTPSPTPSTVSSPTPLASASATPTPTSALQPTLRPTPSPIAFRFDVENRSRFPAVLSVVTDMAGDMRGFESGETGTIVISLGSGSNGIGVEILGPTIGCGYLGKEILATTAPFTLVLTNAPTPNAVTLVVQPGVEGSPRPLPTNDLRCPMG